MKSVAVIVLSSLSALAAGAWAQAQNPAAGASASRVIGEVAAVDTQGRQISMKPDKGDAVTVTLDDKTVLLRVPPGEKDLKQAIRILLSDIEKGDRALAAGQPSADGKSLAARSVIIMSKAEIARKHQQQREQWQKRGAVGTVASIDAAGKSVVVAIRTAAGARPLTVQTGDATDYWRYAPDSVKFSEAKPGAFAEIRVGDQLRALGDRSDDGAAMKAEQVVSGSFRQIAGTVLAVNAEANEIRVTDLSTRKPLTVCVNADSSLRRLSPQLAGMMARSAQKGAAAGHGAQPGGGADGDIQQMLDRMPAFALAELKQGDALIVTSTTGADPARVTAIGVVAGVEPLLTASDGGGQLDGNWDFGDIGLPE